MRGGVRRHRYRRIHVLFVQDAENTVEILRRAAACGCWILQFCKSSERVRSD